MSRYVPGLSKLLLPRMNPFVLIGLADLVTLFFSSFLIQMGSSYLIDTYAAIFIACMTIGIAISNFKKLKNLSIHDLIYRI